MINIYLWIMKLRKTSVVKMLLEEGSIPAYILNMFLEDDRDQTFWSLIVRHISDVTDRRLILEISPQKQEFIQHHMLSRLTNPVMAYGYETGGVEIRLIDTTYPSWSTRNYTTEAIMTRTDTKILLELADRYKFNEILKAFS